MRRTALLLCVALCTACTPAPDPRGRFELDPAATAAARRTDGLSPEQRAALERLGAGGSGVTSGTRQVDDGTFTATIVDVARSVAFAGTWTTNGDDVVLRVERRDGVALAAGHIVEWFAHVDGERVTVAVERGGDPRLVFRRMPR